MESRTDILDVEGANCASCAYAIEHLGRKVAGVSEVSVDSGSRQIRITHAGNPGTLERIIDIVRRLGYEARARQNAPQ
jgi:Cu+-exporting ATPase